MVRLDEKQEEPAIVDTDELVARWRAGDKSALPALLETQYDHIRRALYRLIGPGDDLDDLQQTVLLRVVSSLATFRRESSLTTWIHAICAHVARDHLRRKHTRRIVQTMPEVDDSINANNVHDNDEKRLERNEESRSVRRALDQLSVNHRTVLVLRLVHGYSIDEIAAMTASAKSTTRMRLYYARRAFVRALAEVSP